MNRYAGAAAGFVRLTFDSLGTLGSIFVYPLVGQLLGAFASALTLLFAAAGVVILSG